MGCGLLVASACAILRMRQRGKRGLILSWMIGASSMAVAAAWSAQKQQQLAAIMWALYAFVFLAAALALWVRERLLVHILYLLGSLLLVCDAAVHFALFGSDRQCFNLSLSFPDLACVMLLTGVWLLSLSARQHKVVARAVAEDLDLYADVWLKVLAMPDAAKHLERLHAAVEQVTARHGASAAAVYQMQPAMRDKECQEGAGCTHREGRCWRWLGMAGCRRTSETALAPRGKLRSLDQVYAQAVCLRPILRYDPTLWRPVLACAHCGIWMEM